MFVDRFLLNTAQWLCNRVQELIGLTKFRLEKWAMIASLAFLWICIIRIQPAVTMALIGLFQTFSVWLNISRIEEEELEFLKNGTLRSSTTHNPNFRLMIVCVSAPVTLFSLVMPREIGEPLLYSMIAQVALVYFSACVPRPPSKSKARELYERALIALNESLKPVPAPAN